MRSALVGLVGIGLLAAAGCATGSSVPASPRTAAPPAGAAGTSLPPTKCCVPPPSPHLRIAIHPATGPPGTTVHIHITGCNDPTGANHAVSFNNDSSNVAARNDPNTVRSIEAVQDGTRLEATYEILRADATDGLGAFFVQCGPTLRQADFHVT